MTISGELKKKGYSEGKVNDLPNLDLPRWAYYRHIDGRIVHLPADPISLRRNKNKGFVFLGDELDEPLPDNNVINYSI